MHSYSIASRLFDYLPQSSSASGLIIPYSKNLLKITTICCMQNPALLKCITCHEKNKISAMPKECKT